MYFSRASLLILKAVTWRCSIEKAFYKIRKIYRKASVTEFLLWRRLPCPVQTAPVLIAGFRAGLSGFNLGYPENPPVKPRKPS